MALKNFIKENIVLAIGLALPVLLVVMFFVAAVLPKSMAIPPQYEMLFTTTSYDHQNPPPYNVDFFVKDGMLKARVSRNVRQCAPNCVQSYNWRKLKVYDGKNQSVREISYDLSNLGEAANGSEVVFDAFKNIKIDSSTKAPDGYEFNNPGYRSGGLAMDIFGGGHRNNISRVTKGAVSFKIPNNDGSRYYSGDILFVGWIVGKQ
ncbi:MAG: hypothetical protein V1721_09140 [Pseudomonadota bacterium]